MYFRKIAIQNLHSHVDTTLDMQRLTFIRGANACGKSSVEQAIQLTLAGRADATTSDGKGIAGYIRAGAAKASITLAIIDSDSERILKCALTGDKKPAVIVTKPNDPQYGGGADYLAYLAMHRDTLSCLSNNRYFVDLPEKDQKNILAAIILPKTYEWPEWVKPAVHAAGLMVNWSRTPIEIIDQAYDAAFKARTEANRDIKNFRLPEGDTAEAVHIEQYSREHADLRSKLEDAQKRKYEADGAARAAVAQSEAAKGRLSQAQARLAREEEAVAISETHLLSPSKLKETDKAAKAAGKAAELDQQILKADAEIAANKDAVKKLSALSEEPVCPTCGASITTELVGALLQPLKEARDRNEDQRRASIDARKALGNPAEAASLLEQHNRATEDLKKSKARITEDRAILADAEAAIEAPQPAGASTKQALEVLELGAQLAQVNAKVASARSAKDLLGRIEAAKTERDALTKRQVSLEKLVAYFGPDGVKADLLAATIGDFTASMNAVLASWGYTCSLSIEPYVFAIVFKGDDGKPVEISLKHLSKSQRYRFATAFQVALAQVTGFRFVIVDEADIYDADGKAGLFEAVSCGELDQAIIIGTNESNVAPDIDEAVFYQLADSAQPGMVPATVVRKLVSAPKDIAA